MKTYELKICLIELSLINEVGNAEQRYDSPKDSF
jgi:hypothetical protein